jgi:hypothetical protein
MQKTVTIEIDEAGESSIDLVGFQGKGCADVAKAFQGSDAVTRTEKKRDFKVEAPQIQQQRRA